MIEVWAPRRERVQLHRPGIGLTAMAPRDGGWFAADVDLDDGDEYGFVLDDAPAVRPDPRSRRQPRGVHELSAWFDPAAHAWTDARLDGSPAGRIGHLRAAHRHLHPRGHPRFRDRAARSPRRPRHRVRRAAAGERLQRHAQLGLRRRALVRRARGVRRTGGVPALRRRLPRGAGSASSRTSSTTTSVRAATTCPSSVRTSATAERNTWGSSIDLDEPEVRRYIVENALMWMRDYHVDGLRLDAVHALKDSSARHILQELAEATDALSAHLGRPLTLIAESDLNDATLIAAREAGGLRPRRRSGATTTTTRCTSPSRARRPATTRTSSRCRRWSKVATAGFFHDGTLVVLPRARRTATRSTRASRPRAW